ncbi:MAG: purine nucleoside phosphorylase DeoD-type [Candidatus Tyloplasma litorale]|nr:MAG: purine nucleoside phosphorylase DeoD-type [Mycoplasmatales bacterium]
MPTPHIQAKKGEIAKIVLMPGDPLRAKLFAETYLENYRLINEVRGMLGYTGTYKGKEVTVMGHGMGLDSIGIYAYELYTEFEVEKIIRFGSCGAYNLDINVWDVIISEKAYSKSNYGEGFGFEGKDTISASKNLIQLAKEASKEVEINHNVLTTKINSSMWFYKTHNVDVPEQFVKKGIDVVEMEGYALYAIAKSLGKEALVLLTVSDHVAKHEYTTSEERRIGFTDMFKILLKIVEKL